MTRWLIPAGLCISTPKFGPFCELRNVVRCQSTGRVTQPVSGMANQTNNSTKTRRRLSPPIPPPIVLNSLRLALKLCVLGALCDQKTPRAPPFRHPTRHHPRRLQSWSKAQTMGFPISPETLAKSVPFRSRLRSDDSCLKLHAIALVRIADPGIGHEHKGVCNHRRKLLPGNDLDVLQSIGKKMHKGSPASL